MNDILFALVFLLGHTFGSSCDNVGCGTCEGSICSSCKIGYNHFRDDCDTCDFYLSSNPVDSFANPVYLNIENECVDVSNKIESKTFDRMPVDLSDLTLTSTETSIPIDLSTVTPSIPPCVNTSEPNDYRFGKWYSITLEGSNQMSLYDMKIFQNEEEVKTKEVYIQIGKMFGETMTCSTVLFFRNSTSSLITLDYSSFLIFVGVNDGYNYSLSFKAKATSNEEQQFNPSFIIDGNDYLEFIDDTNNYTTFGVPKTMIVGDKNLMVYQMKCKDSIRRGIFFSVKTVPYHTILLDTRLSQRYHYAEEIGINPFSCKMLHIGDRGGLTITEGAVYGLLVGIYSEIEETRHFFMSIENEPLTLRIQIPCVNKCNQNEGSGQCVLSEARCYCNDGYGFEQCNKLCYYNNQFQSDLANPCYLGIPGCNKNCECDDGYEYEDHYCISKKCSSTGVGSCSRDDKHCLINCECMEGFEPTPDHRCKPKTCGNGHKDLLEECDSGKYCNDLCQCKEGYEPNENDPTSCRETGVLWWHILLMVVGSVFIVLVIILPLFIIILFAVKRRKIIDPELYKLPQQSYFVNFSHSKLLNPTKYDKKLPFHCGSTSLTFGNYEFISVGKTYFNEIGFKNNRKKWMLVIAHLPKSPKFVFHSEPEYLLIGPKRRKTMTLYLTLFCTTKLAGMKIPTTIYFSNRKSVLQEIIENLKNKTEETFSANDKELHELIMKDIKSKYHFYFDIKTESASSTDLDLEEIKMNETPIGEGSYSTVYLGSYRGIFVAVKTFKMNFSNIEERRGLVREVKAECNLMRKLRNPYIIGYIGSVTYIPQISIVMPYAMFDSLNHYCRPPPVGIKLSYKFKMRILKDISKGMVFLHENSIMHLDLKPDNILLSSLSTSSDSVTKITDFGTSRIKRNSDKGLGTPLYLAPETYEDQYCYASDVYSFAITSWELVTEEEPYCDFQDVFAIRSHVLAGKRLPFPECVTDKLKNVIDKCWEQDANKRPNFGVISTWMLEIVNETPEVVLPHDDDVDNEKISSLIEEKKRIMEQVIFD